jgi:B12-binding domain/radical SAM domain protein
MKEADLTLIHPPTIYDFRERLGIWSPINDLVPSTPIFEMYPLGFASIASYLERQGFYVKIDNIALKMLCKKNFDVEEHLRKIKTKAVGIDLHWLPHVHGAINLAKIFKKWHPEIPIIFGGLSSSYYYHELMKFDYIDFVIRGDSCELPLLKLLNILENGKDYGKVPNLVYKKSDKIVVNPLSYVPRNLDDFSINYSFFLKGLKSMRSLMDFIPYMNFLDKPIMAVLSCKGCKNNCPTCGGSRFAYRNICRRRNIAFKEPEKIVEDILAISSFKSPCFIIGDLLQISRDYGERILELLKKEDIDIPVIFEFFSPPTRLFLDKLSKSIPDFSIEISPESHDEEIRRLQGRCYTNNELTKMIDTALEKGCNRFDIYFIIGLGHQTWNSVMETVRYCEHLLEKFSNDGRIQPFLSPYAPFLDPGSLAFEHPNKYGFIKHCKTLKDHFDLLETAITWRDLLSYETQYLKRSEIVELTYRSAMKLASIKENYGILTQDEKEKILYQINASRKIIKTVDELRAKGLSSQMIREDLEYLNNRIFCGSSELNWSKIGIKEVLKNFGLSLR